MILICVVHWLMGSSFKGVEIQHAQTEGMQVLPEDLMGALYKGVEITPDNVHDVAQGAGIYLAPESQTAQIQQWVGEVRQRGAMISPSANAQLANGADWSQIQTPGTDAFIAQLVEAQHAMGGTTRGARDAEQDAALFRDGVNALTATSQTRRPERAGGVSI